MTSFQNAPPICPQQSSVSFTQAFLLGQLSIVILFGAFIKYFIFGDRATPEKIFASIHSHKRSLTPVTHKLNNKRSSSNILRNPSTATTAAILSKTYYNVNHHQPESLDWFNVLIAQTIAQIRNDAHQDNAILTSLTSALNGPNKPEYLSSIEVKEISLGDDFPIFSNCRIHPVDDPEGAAGRLQARMDVDLSDFITLGIETKILLNYPRPRTAILPVALTVSVVRFSGTLSISFLPSSASASSSSPTTLNPNLADGFTNANANTRNPTALAFSFLPDYTLSLSVRSLLGSRTRLQDVPKIGRLVETRLHAWFDERCVQPRMQQVELPSFWPRKKNVVRGEGGGEEGNEEEGDGNENAEVKRQDVEGREDGEERSGPAGPESRIRSGSAGGMRWRGRKDDDDNNKAFPSVDRDGFEGYGSRDRERDQARDQSRRSRFESSMPSGTMPGSMPGMILS